MSNAMRVVLASSLTLMLGCSDKAGQPGGEGAAGLTILQDVDSLLRAGAGSSGRAPAKLADLDRFESMYTRGFHAVKSGDVVVIWGAALKGEGQTGQNESVVAYEKAVPSEGGLVLLSAGSIKKMSADEFKAAPKAGH